MSIKVIVNGAAGRMGQITATTIEHATDMQLVAITDKGDDLASKLREHHPDIVIDFTVPDVVFENTKTIIEHNVRPVIGTTGFTESQRNTLIDACNKKQLGGIIAPNFSLGALLMMKYAKDATRYFPNAEIIEMHHDQKVDAPSGTALNTIKLMSEHQPENPPQPINPEHPARGETHGNHQVHSVRLPGLFAHQMVIFGGTGETLTLRHDAITREAMMPGVLLACRHVMNLDHMVYGLETLIN